MLPVTSPLMAGRRIVVIGASAGGVAALTKVLAALPPEFPAPIVVVQHRAPTGQSRLVAVLARKTPLSVVEVREGDALRAGVVYVARADLHLTITPDRHFAYRDGHRINYVLSSVNPLFASSAESYGVDAIAVVLSGSGRDGTDGVQAIKAHGGTVIVQDEATSAHFAMPRSAIESGAVDMVLPIELIAPALLRLVADPERTLT